MSSVKALLAGQVAVGSNVEVKGWVRTRRDSKAGISFMAVHDGTCFDPIQAVIPNTLENYTNDVLNAGTGAAVIVRGELVESQGQGQSVEIQASEFELVGEVIDPETYPIAKKRHSFEYLRSVAHLRPRTNSFGAVTRVRTVLANSIHNYFFNEGFQWINTPIITASDCEGAGELFRVSTLDMVNTPMTKDGKVDYSEDFFGKESFLTVSGQLNAEAYALAMSKVYTFGPTFRAENSHTSRHLAEFWMVEPEIAFANLSDDIDLAEGMLQHSIKSVLNQCESDLGFFNKMIDKGLIERLKNVAETPFARIPYTDAIDILKKSGKKFEYPVEWGIDLQSEHERWLAEEYVKGPVVLTDYPKDIKAFYMRLNDDGKTVAAMDVLAPGIGEIIGGAQREERLDVLDARMAESGLEGQLGWYRELRQYGTVPHAGFGLGFDRFLNYVTGMENIRDVIPFPRVPNNADF
ncbi:MAG: asparagine--tRNA ligase [Gammaproteobacteria bacterium]|nr:asparagine--tRNA ligase [Gammaproteobacteria bacterium]